MQGVDNPPYRTFRHMWAKDDKVRAVSEGQCVARTGLVRTGVTGQMSGSAPQFLQVEMSGAGGRSVRKLLAILSRG